MKFADFQLADFQLADFQFADFQFDDFQFVRILCSLWNVTIMLNRHDRCNTPSQTT